MDTEADIEAAAATLRLALRILILTAPPALFALSDVAFIKILKTSWSEIVGVPGREHPLGFAVGIAGIGTAVWAHLCVDWNDPLKRASKRWLRG